MSKTGYYTHPTCWKHEMGPGHPECPERLDAIQDRLLISGVDLGLTPMEAPEAPLADIELAHDRMYIASLRGLSDQLVEDMTAGGPSYAHMDADTAINASTWKAALCSAGAAIAATDAVIAGELQNAFCAVRPPGHHAERAKAGGFCFFNNVAIAGMYARKKHGAERIAVVDFDVHHGNGTQDIFWNDKDLFLASTHQMPLYPGTGALNETGVGNIWNAPLRPGDGGEPFREAFESRILPALRNFGPDILLVSAGFDAHRDDPLANLELVEADFAWATDQLAHVAAKHAGGRLVSMLEGGYNLAALGRSAAAHVKGLMAAGA